MWYIKVEGRKGHYNGYSEKGINSSTTTQIINDPDGEYYTKKFRDNVTCELEVTNIQLCPIFKKDASEVKTEFSFSKKEDADKAIKCIVKHINNKKSFTLETWKGWQNGFYIYVIHTDKFKFEAMLPKMIAVEDTDSLINKKHNFAGKQLPYTLNGGSYAQVCNCCRITLGKDEPAMTLGYYEATICINCLERMASMLKTEYAKHPQAEELTTAWVLEKMNEDVN